MYSAYSANEHRRYLLAEKYFERIDIFEQRSSIGGVWNHSPGSYKARVPTVVPHVNPNGPAEEPIWFPPSGNERLHRASFVSPIYERLETNIPKELMAFSDKPFAPGTQLFPRHQQVRDYLEEYAADVKHLVRFETQVLDLRPKDSGIDNWVLTTRSLRTGIKKSGFYDAVVVSNGHYTVPYIPDIAGIRLWNEAYPGVISHAKSYDSPEAFRGKKVVVVGNSASGIDVSSQISEFCKGQLLLSSKTTETSFTGAADTEKIECPEIVEFLPPTSDNRGIRFANGRVEKEIDAIVFCTGYLYSYPFLHFLNPPVVTDGARAMNVYQQLFYTYNPTLVFPVLPQRVIPFPLSENQAAVFARVWSGRLALPSRTEMEAWEAGVVAAKSDGKAFHLLPFPQDADYVNFLYDWASNANKRSTLANDGNGKQGIRWGEAERWWRQHMLDIRKAYVREGEHRSNIKSLGQLGFGYEQWKREHGPRN